jgi:hypothetical protein
MNLSERVAQLEQQLASMHSNRDATPQAMSLPKSAASHNKGPPSRTIPSRPQSSGSSYPFASLPLSSEILPVLSLFDNAILVLDEKNTFNHSIHREFSGEYLKAVSIESSPHFQKSRIKRTKICEALTSLLPSHTAMYAILEAGGVWWDILRQMYPYLCNEDTKMTLPTYVFLALNQDNPVIIGCALSWIALSIQCLPLDFESSHLSLPLPVDDLAEHYISNVDRLVVSDDELSVSLEGIENILLQSQFYGNVARPRKAWTTIRRGISHATMLGLHRASTPPSSASSPRVKRRESIWWHLVECESYLSLLLGLPSFMPATLWDLGRDETGKTSTISCAHYRRKLSIIVGTISQRNQANPTSSLSGTLDIDHELESLASLMPIHWWDLIAPSKESSKDALEIHERISTQFWHHQAKAYLHLPFMLQSPTDGSYDHSGTQCLIASRKMIQMYITMRELTGGRINICRVIDFQAFTAAVILMLGLLGYRPKPGPEDSHQELVDSDLVDTVIEVLRRVRCERENLTAAQCLQALETLVTIGRGQSPAEEWKCRIFIPYCGMISIAPGSKYAVAKTTVPRYPAQMTTASLDEGASAATAHAEDCTESPVIEIDVFNAPFLGSFIPNSQSIPHPTDPNEFSFQDTLAMDIDQDWSWMLNQNYQQN